MPCRSARTARPPPPPGWLPPAAAQTLAAPAAQGRARAAGSWPRFSPHCFSPQCFRPGHATQSQAGKILGAQASTPPTSACLPPAAGPAPARPAGWAAAARSPRGWRSAGPATRSSPGLQSCSAARSAGRTGPSRCRRAGGQKTGRGCWAAPSGDREEGLAMAGSRSHAVGRGKPKPASAPCSKHVSSTHQGFDSRAAQQPEQCSCVALGCPRPQPPAPPAPPRHPPTSVPTPARA